MNKSNVAIKNKQIQLENVATVEKNNEKQESTAKVGVLYYVCKKIIDILAGLTGTILIIFITIFVAIMRLVKKENDGPIFYTQIRVGKNGKQFKLYKYRSMVMNADEKLKDYLEKNEKAREEYKKYKKLKKDPRITTVGKFLRKTSLDEFPQFINVLKGDMSFVGPRPYLYREKEDMGESFNKIVSVKPGITGYWQVNGRNDVDFQDRLNMDTYYIEHRGLVMDLKIILKTFLKTLKKEGAR